MKKFPRLAFCHEAFTGGEPLSMTWEEQCRFLAGAGYKGLEVAPFALTGDPRSLTETHLRELREVAQSFELEIPALHWLFAKAPVALHLTNGDPETQKVTSEYLVTLAKIAHHLGAKFMVLGSPKQRNLLDGISFEIGLANAARVIEGAIGEIGQLGVTLLIEPLTTKETNFINTCAQGLKLVELVGHPSFMLHQDCKAMLGQADQELPIEQAIAKFAPYTRHFHVNDVNTMAPGCGDVNFTPICRALQQSDYAGWVSVEIFDYKTKSPIQQAHAAIAYLKACWKQAQK